MKEINQIRTVGLEGGECGNLKLIQVQSISAWMWMEGRQVETTACEGWGFVKQFPEKVSQIKKNKTKTPPTLKSKARRRAELLKPPSFCKSGVEPSKRGPRRPPQGWDRTSACIREEALLFLLLVYGFNSQMKHFCFGIDDVIGRESLLCVKRHNSSSILSDILKPSDLRAAYKRTNNPRWWARKDTR